MDNFDSKTDQNNLEFLSHKQPNILSLASLKSVVLASFIPRLPLVARPNILVPFAGLLLSMILLSGFELVTSEVTVALLEKNVEERLDNQLAGISSSLNKVNSQLSTVATARIADLTSGVDYVEGKISSLNKGVNLIKNEIVFWFAEWPTIVILATQPIATKVDTLSSGLKSFGQDLAESFTTSRDSVLWAQQNIDPKDISLALSFKTDFSDWGNNLLVYGKILSTNLAYYLERIGANWQSFISPTEKAQAPIDQALLREQIKADILAELSRNQVISNTIANQSVIPKINNTGLVVAPQGSATSTQALKSQVDQMFSDEVSVKFDQSGQAGIITPIFKTKTGRSYIFLLTPVKE